MATTTKLQINLSNAYGDEKTVSFSDPKESLSLENVRNGFNAMFQNGFIMNREYTQPLTAVKSARYVVTTTSELS